MSTARTPAAPSSHRRALIVWVAVYPTITVLLALVRPLLGQLPLPLQTLVVTAMAVPLITYILIPALTRLERRGTLAAARRREASR